ncbi:hypothetical protein P152DRAFT_462404 [Eremomyces bilateralis CBS 781.70]|uniref:Acyltransferase 3 domain-containing protein n=1 Tax=Eremomyces bilateralis CBS 781.70 TaxID=1392243 RepID=A0A6G1FRZ0_9PEZI|nr:uncharacterized protein P152DRAFT_462404 [Eremomyces bilateralis CBS 781.70]KAF1808537.1 hypothetical protein P152DRAFT_462404 [Eremomyces bilateralis CBS 781.70]
MPTDDSTLEKGAADDLISSNDPTQYASLATSRFRSFPRSLVPTFSLGASQNDPNRKLGRTAYLDGLRGFAAFLVYWSHHQSWGHDKGHIYESGYGYNGQHYLVQLPGLRMFFSGGHFAVAVFFVISGYVLSAKPLTLIASKEYVKLEEYLASAVFRRWTRLYLPIIVTSLLFATWWHVFGTRVFKPVPTYVGEFQTWLQAFIHLSWDWRLSTHMWFRYNFHMWTIPVEYRGSLYVYTSLIAFSRASKNMRLLCTIFSIIYTLLIIDGWYLSLFVAGMLLCDLDQLAAQDRLPAIFDRVRPYQTRLLWAMFVISVFLSGVPAEEKTLADNPGWYYLSYLVPDGLKSTNPDSKWFFHFWAATFMVVCCRRFSWLKTFFEAPFNQYLGRVSYALYLVHGPVLWILADPVYALLGWSIPTTRENPPQWGSLVPAVNLGPLGLEFNFLLGHLVILPMTLWVAELCTRGVDEPSVRASHWLYKRFIGTP